MSNFDLKKERRTGLDFSKSRNETRKDETICSTMDNVAIESLDPVFLKQKSRN